MTDLGLNNRLQQRSRRAGLMIGISMALTIAVCVASFSMLYAALDGFVGDFVSDAGPAAGAPAQTPLAQVAAQVTPTEAAAAPVPTQVPAAVGATEPPVAATVAPVVEEATPPAFAPDYQSGGYSLNLRSEPSAEGGDQTVVTVLTPSTPLQYLNEERPTANPGQDGTRWLRFRTEAGDEGWLREIDTAPYQP